jgi:AAA+ ATPase superfamily predicted ATPase
MAFYDRKKEAAEIQGLLSSSKFELLILYGRRRVGKTELVLHSTKGRKRLYYLATTEKNLERFHSTCIEFDPAMANLKPDFEVLLGYLKDRAEVVIIDEFQNMIKENKNIVSTLQAVVDTKLKNSKLKLILLGSSVSLMNSKVLSYQSPLYGRRTASIKLKAVSFFDLAEFYPKASKNELVEIFGFADGIPYYLVRIDNSFWKWLENEAKSESTFLRDEVDFLMRYEFDNPSTYKLILEAIANGKTAVNEIKDFIKVQRTDLSPYLKNLLEVDLIKREIPITENQKSRLGRYYLKDNFLKFWFKFIYPDLSGIEAGIFDTKQVKREYSAYLGYIFEEVAKQFLIRNNGVFKFSKIGKWWGKGDEIDIVAINEPEMKFLFAECKWKDNVNADEVCKRLKEKTAEFHWNKQKRTDSYAIFAKSFSKKINEFQGIEVKCLDLGDLD